MQPPPNNTTPVIVSPAGQPVTPAATGVATKSGIDLTHVSIVVAFIFGVAYGAKSLIMAAISGHSSASGLTVGFITLIITSVAAFIKDKPGSWQVAFQDGDQTGENAPLAEKKK